MTNSSAVQSTEAIAHVQTNSLSIGDGQAGGGDMNMLVEVVTMLRMRHLNAPSYPKQSGLLLERPYGDSIRKQL
jgi:hypothetical protein